MGPELGVILSNLPWWLWPTIWHNDALKTQPDQILYNLEPVWLQATRIQEQRPANTLNAISWVQIKPLVSIPLYWKAEVVKNDKGTVDSMDSAS